MSIELRKIIPPNLSYQYLGQKILCHRSMRFGSPRFDILKINDKIIANNYGHGGSGWTIGPGSAEYVNKLLINSEYSKKLNYNTPISIIGAGIIGLFTAYDLYKKGFKHITTLADQFEYLVSHNAGGLLAPVSMSNDSEVQKLIDQLGIDAYKFFKLIAQGKHQDFKQGVSIVPTYFRDREHSGLEPYVNIVMKPAKDVLLDFNNGTTQKMVAYDDGIFIDTSLLMQELKSHLKDKVIFKRQKISDFSEIKSNFIINCSGIGAIKLNHDEKLVPVQGHLIMLKDQNPKHLDHMIFTYLDETINQHNQHVQRAFYISPKKLSNSKENDIGVIGGSFIKNANYKTPNTEEFEYIINNAKKFYGIT